MGILSRSIGACSGTRVTVGGLPVLTVLAEEGLAGGAGGAMDGLHVC